MNVPGGSVRAFLATERPTFGGALAALRLVFLALFGAQVVVALAIGVGVALVLPVRPAPNDAFAFVLLVFAAGHVPLAWVLGRAAARGAGKQAALSATVVGAVVNAVPAWFAALMVISAQRAPFLAAAAAVLCLAYGIGFATVSAAARAATRTPPAPAEDHAA